MKTIDYNKRAEYLAKELLGKTINCNGHKYMITVTEAYPFDEKCEEGREISYVNRSKRSKGHDVLTGKDKIGTCFVYGGMLHIVCKGGMSQKWENEYSCDNILIRGAIKVEKDRVIQECETLNFVTGNPYVLCHDKLGIVSNQLPINLCDGNVFSDVIIADYKSYADENIKSCKRVNINNDSKLRFYIDKDCILKEI